MRRSASTLAATAALVIATTSTAWALSPSRPLIEPIEGTLASHLPDSQRRLLVNLDAGALVRVEPGDTFSLTLPGLGDLAYRAERVERGAEVLTIEARPLVGEGLAVIGIRAEGVSGYLRTPRGDFVIGYVNDAQWIGVAGQDFFPEDYTLGRTLVMRPRILDSATALVESPRIGAQPVEIDLAELTSLNPGDEALLPLPGVGTLRVTYEHTDAGGESATWIGYLKDFGTDYRVTITYGPGGTFGHILSPAGELDIVSGATPGAWLIDPLKMGLIVKADEDCARGVPAEAAKGATRAGATATTGISAPVTATNTATTAATIDVLVYYPASLAAYYGGEAGARTRIDQLVALSNQAYRDSSMNVQVRLVGAEPVDVSDSLANNTVLDMMRQRQAVFAGLTTKRNALGADLVTFVRPFFMSAHGSCGVGYVGGYGGASIAGYAELGLSVVAEGTDRAGTNYYCDVSTFAHELGHNMGAMHDRATVVQQGGGSGAYPYAFGYGFSGRFGTVMSYIWPRAMKFSNPDLWTCGSSERCGVPETDAASSANNAKALNLTAPIVAGFRTASTVTPTPTPTPTVFYTVSGVLSVKATTYDTRRQRYVTTTQRLANAQVAGSSAQVSCTKSAWNGAYSCKVPAAFTGTLAPVDTVTYNWTPLSRSYANVQGNLSGANFVGVRK
jgi:hypothetical protein